MLGRLILAHMPALALLFAVPFGAAVLEGARELVAPLGLVFGLCAVLAIIALRAGLPADIRRVEVVGALAVLFLLAALLAVPGFVRLGLSPVDAFFEAMSGITTTGLSVARGAEDWPIAAHVLRAWLQWAGGLVMATAALAMILDPGVPTQRLGEVEIDERDLLTSSRKQARQLLIAYLAITALGIAGALLLLPTAWEAVVVTLAAVSTGGFAPRGDSLASYGLLAQAYVIFLCLLGAVSLMTPVLIARRVPLARAFASARRVLGVLGIIAAAYVTMLVLGGEHDWRAIARHLLNLASAQTTAGYSVSDMPTQPPLLLLVIVAMAIGADIGSTGGGLKISRVLLLAQTIRLTLQRPRLPATAVAHLRFRGERMKADELAAVVALMGVYVLAALGIWFTLLAAGYPAMESLFDTVSALSTVGLGTGVVGPDLPDRLTVLFTFAMWLGRLEFIAVLVLLMPRSWRRNRN